MGGSVETQNTIGINNKKNGNRTKKRTIKQSIARNSGMSSCFIF